MRGAAAPRPKGRRPLPLASEPATPEAPAPAEAARRGARRSACLIIALVPLLLLAWALYITVPVAIEARRAAGKVFVTRVARPSFVTPGASPGSANASPPALATGAAPTPTPTLVPGAPTFTPAPPTPTPYPEWTGDQPVTILLLGVDTRATDTSPPRSDTMIIVRVDPVAKRVDMVSIPRDLLVDIPGFYATKINAAYPFGEVNADTIPGGGPTLAAETVELNFGIKIDYFAEVDIAGMEKMIDTLGGIIVDVPGIIKDDQYPTNDFRYTRVYFTPGLQWMNGERAVRYSRTRHDGGDFQRNSHQQQVLLAMRDKALESGIISKLPELISEVGDAFRTDLSPRQWYQLARLSQEIDASNIYIHSIAPLVEEEDINGVFFWVGDWDALRAVVDDLPNDPNGRPATEPPNTVAPVVTSTPDDSAPPANTPTLPAEP